MPNFTDEQILEIVKRHDQGCACVLEGEGKWASEYVDYALEETNVDGKYISEPVIYKVKGEKNRYVAVDVVIIDTGYWGDSDIVKIDAYFVVPKEVTKIVYVKESND